MKTYQLECLAEFWRDAEHIFPVHYKEMALKKDRFPMALDFPKYAQAENDGVLHIVTVRDAGRLVGYFIAGITGHLHYATSGLMAYNDMYFILPEHRRGGTGAKMFVKVLETLRERGVVEGYFSTKVHQDHGAFFEALGGELTDKTYRISLGRGA